MKNKLSLSKFVDFFWIILLLTIIFYVVFDINNIFSTLKEIQKEKIVSTLKAETTIIAPLVKFDFTDSLRDEFHHLLKINKDIKYLAIKKIKVGKRDAFNNTLIIPIYYKKDLVGNLIVQYSDKNLINSFVKYYFTRFIIYFIIIFVISLAFLIYLRNKVKSLNILAKKVENINFKKQSSIPITDNYYENINITNAINRLLLQINHFYKTQRSLIKTMNIYKKQLETAQKIAEIFTWQYDCEQKEFTSKNFIYFKNKLKLDSINEFIDHIENRESFLEKIEKLCHESNSSLEEIISVKVINKTFFFKIEAKRFLQKDKNIIIGIFADVTEDIQRQKKISYLAYHDPLTGLVNRTYLKEELKTLTHIAQRNNKKLALVFIDLDNFKFINDTYGHEVGDNLLIQISNRIKANIRKSDIASRIGGDEFVLVLNNINSKKDIDKILEKIMKELSIPVVINGNKIEITFSAGIALFPDDTKDITTLFQYSDIAMYDAKKEGKNRYKYINIKLQEKIKNFYQTLDELKQALKNNELVLYFQPKIDIQENKVDGVEALIRWEHPKKGLLTPYHFIDIAEKGGIINKIDSYVLEKSIKTLKKWEKIPQLKNLNLAVNISANKFLEPGFVNELKNLLEKYNINPEKLQIEITETLSIQNFDYTILTLNDIKSLGIKIALDDFGTGYSSLNYIKKIPFDILKIDQSFIKDLLKDKDDVIITKMIVGISNILNKENVAEGVENKEILEIVKSLGVKLVQGYYFSKPVNQNDLCKFIDSFEKNQ